MVTLPAAERVLNVMQHLPQAKHAGRLGRSSQQRPHVHTDDAGAVDIDAAQEGDEASHDGLPYPEWPCQREP